MARSKKLRALCLTVGGLLLPGLGSVVHAQSLRGTSASLDRQTQQAHGHGFEYLKDAADVTRLLKLGMLVPLSGNDDYELHLVSFPYARPEVRLFVERLAAEYRAECGQRLVVTSLTRPQSRQPRNASRRSVHPTGMALDLRRPWGPCRRWLEDALLHLEGRGLLEATRERNPAHYHVALFPSPYREYVARVSGATGSDIVVREAPLTAYTVRRSDTLWEISRIYDTTPESIRLANGLRSSRIYPGQVLKVPIGSER